ncbi:MAG: Holliday junction resolvase RuvX [Planctomycetes bacterium]|nr:Holliday junction resolvase RuvX [Planctomycetota bacterium]
MKILAVDFGDRRTGMAISDPDEQLAMALPTLAMRQDGADAERVAAVARDQGAQFVVVGLPRNMNGTEGPRSRAAREFADDIHAACGLPIDLWDERLSTAEGESRLRQAGFRRRALARRSDAAAAIVILESYLAHRRASR